MRYNRKLFFVIVAVISFAACGGHSQVPPTALATSAGSALAQVRHTKFVGIGGATPPPGLLLNSCKSTTDPFEPNAWNCYVDYESSVKVPNGGKVGFSASSGGCIIGCDPGKKVVSCEAYFPPLPAPSPSYPVTLDFGSQKWNSDCQAKTVPFFFTVKTGIPLYAPRFISGSITTGLGGQITLRDGTVQYTDFYSEGDNGLLVNVYLPVFTKSTPAPTPTPRATPCAQSTPGPDTTKPILLFDANGNPILKIDGSQVSRPDDGHNPQFFINQGLFASPISNVQNLISFWQGGPWDEQRINGQFYNQFRDYATIAIGLYAAAAGTPENENLTLQNAAAGLMSRYAPDTKFDPTYTHLPVRNVYDTTLGYQLYKSKAFALCSSP